MENWRDRGLVLTARPLGEGACLLHLLTEQHGLYAGYLPGGMSQKLRSMTMPGALVDARWQSRLETSLGIYQLDLVAALSAGLLGDGGKLLALKSACSLCRTALAEREPEPAQFRGLRALLELLAGQGLTGQDWEESYIYWEIAFLRELGCSLDLSRCASTGSETDLIYVSPKSGRTVSREAGEPYRDKLLPLPLFLQSSRQTQVTGKTGRRSPGNAHNAHGDGIVCGKDSACAVSAEADRHHQIRQAMALTGFFLRKHVYGPTSLDLPEDRKLLEQAYITD